MSTRLSGLFHTSTSSVRLFLHGHQTGWFVPREDTSTSSFRSFPHVHQTGWFVSGEEI